MTAREPTGLPAASATPSTSGDAPMSLPSRPEPIARILIFRPARASMPAPEQPEEPEDPGPQAA